MNGIGRILNLLRKETPSPGTDYTGTVTKVEGGVAYVQLAGSDIDDTPVRMSVAAKKGDTVRIRVNKGKAWITGNDTAPPTDDAYAKESEIILSNEIEKTNVTLKTVEGVATEAHKIAGNTDQYFWHVTSGTDTGAHLTEIPQDQFLEDPENGGGNLLARTNGIAIRDGLTELAQFGTTVVIGQGSGSHAEISPSGMSIYNDTPSLCLDVGASETTVEAPVVTVDGRTYAVTSSSGANKDLTRNATMHEIPSDSQGSVLNSLTFYYTVIYINSSYENKKKTWSHKERVSIVNGTASHSASFVGGDNVKRTVTITFDKGTKHLTATVNDAYRLEVTCVYYEFLTNANAPTFMYGSLASDGSVGGFSAAMGANLNAAGDYQLVTGKWNANDTNNVFEIGNGTAENARANVFSVDKTGNVKIAREITSDNSDISRSFLSLNQLFEAMMRHVYIFGGLVYFSIEIFINGTYIPNYTYTIGSIAAGYRPLDTQAIGTGHSTDQSANPLGAVTWIAKQSGDLQIILQSGQGPYIFLSGFYRYK